ncbi:MAG: hypothetical protein PWQ11_243 [Candidatus Diapherotrites archaeon]|nr:hypothetical protein [Candidatus Diapherotrites archaeon]
MEEIGKIEISTPNGDFSTRPPPYVGQKVKAIKDANLNP